MKEARGRISQKEIRYLNLQHQENLIQESGELQLLFLIRKNVNSVCCVHRSVHSGDEWSKR